MILTAAEDRLCALGDVYAAQISAAHEDRLAVDCDMVVLTAFEGHVCAGFDDRGVDAMLSAVHGKRPGQGDTCNADAASAIVHITERHQSRIFTAFAAPVIQRLDSLDIAVLKSAVCREISSLRRAVGSCRRSFHDQSFPTDGAHRVTLIAALMLTLRELHPVCRVTVQLCNFSCLVDGNPCAILLSIQFALRMVRF